MLWPRNYIYYWSSLGKHKDIRHCWKTSQGYQGSFRNGDAIVIEKQGSKLRMAWIRRNPALEYRPQVWHTLSLQGCLSLCTCKIIFCQHESKWTRSIVFRLYSAHERKRKSTSYPTRCCTVSAGFLLVFTVQQGSVQHSHTAGPSERRKCRWLWAHFHKQ